MALIIGACPALQVISQNSDFTGVGSAVKAGFDYQGVACVCIIKDF